MPEIKGLHDGLGRSPGDMLQVMAPSLRSG
jgi:hypothetical protein